MDCIVHGVVKSQTRLSDFHFHPALRWDPLGEKRVAASNANDTEQQAQGSSGSSQGSGHISVKDLETS